MDHYEKQFRLSNTIRNLTDTVNACYGALTRYKLDEDYEADDSDMINIHTLMELVQHELSCILALNNRPIDKDRIDILTAVVFHTADDCDLLYDLLFDPSVFDFNLDEEEALYKAIIRIKARYNNLVNWGSIPKLTGDFTIAEIGIMVQKCTNRLIKEYKAEHGENEIPDYFTMCKFTGAIDIP